MIRKNILGHTNFPQQQLEFMRYVTEILASGILTSVLDRLSPHFLGNILEVTKAGCLKDLKGG
jgi:hypothetical protein